MSDDIRTLRRARPRSRFVTFSVLAILGIVLLSFATSDFAGNPLLDGRRAENFERFLGELRPFPLQGKDFDWGVAAAWASEFIDRRGGEATARTLAISVVAIVLTGLLSAGICLFATRTFATAEPFAPAARAPRFLIRLAWGAVVGATRALLLFLRSIPEYVWAFLLLMVFGPTVWTAVAALALHNLGKLARLFAETVENLPPPVPAALRGLGARRAQIAVFGLLPAAIPRFLLYFFYRWESCVREATVLGMLGVVSLGYWIDEARAATRYDEMLLLILLGAGIVIVGDLVSAVARAVVRRAG